MEKLDINIKSLEDLEKCPWNGVFKSTRIFFRVFNLQNNGIDFMLVDEFGAHLESVVARVSNFSAVGRTFNIEKSSKMRKYDGKRGSMYFLQGLYLSGDDDPNYYLAFLEYVPGNELPNSCDFKLNKKDVVIIQ